MGAIKRKNGNWYVDFWHNGKRYREVSPVNGCAGAKEYEALRRQELVNKKPGTEAIAKIDSIPTFKDFSKKWFELYVETNNKYSETLNKASVLRAHLNPFFGEKQLDKICSLDIENFKAEKKRKGLSHKTINNHLIVLSKCLKTAREWEVIINVPKMKLLKVPPQKFDHLSKEECQLLLDHCDGILKEMLLFGIKTGLRFGELIALEWKDVNFQNRSIAVQRSFSRGRLGSPKSNKTRYIPLLNDVLQMLKVRAKKTGFVFSKGDNKPINQTPCLRWLHKACKRAGLRQLGWKDVRHSFASLLAEKSVSIIFIKELLGHADVKTTMRYAHLSPLAVRGAVETLNDNFGHNLDTIADTTSKKLSLPIPVIPEISTKTQ